MREQLEDCSNRTYFKLNKNCMLFLSDPKSKQNCLKIQGGEQEPRYILCWSPVLLRRLSPPPFPPPTTAFPFINCPHRNSLKGYNLYSGWWGAEDFTLLYLVLEKAFFFKHKLINGTFASGSRNWHFKRV